MSAPIVEIFSSIQGEGLLLGERQVFLRFAGCNLCCAYCDTTGAQVVPSQARVERTAGRRDFTKRPSAMTPEEVAEAVRHLVRPRPDLHHSVSLTGGEPLLHAPFLQQLLPKLGDLGLRIYLETNGTLVEELALMLPGLDVVCADIKLPSATGQGPVWGAHEMFLLTLAAFEDPARLDFAKAIIAEETPAEEVDRAARLLAGVNAEIPLVLQPLTPTAGLQAPSADQMLDLQAVAKRYLSTVRVIPQTHRLGGTSEGAKCSAGFGLPAGQD